MSAVPTILSCLQLAIAGPDRIAEIPLPTPGICIAETGNPAVPFLVGLESPGGLLLVLDDHDGGYSPIRLPGFGCPSITRGSHDELVFCIQALRPSVFLLDPDGRSGWDIPLPGLLEAPAHAESHDFDADSTDEILLADERADLVALLDWCAGDEPRVLLRARVNDAKSAVPVDMDMDGDPDIVTCGCGEGTGWIENDGGFDPSVRRPVDLLGIGVKDLAAADLDMDGDLDLLAAACCSSAVYEFRNDPGASWTRATLFALAVPKALAIASLNGDSLPDLVVACMDRGAGISMLVNPGPGTDGPWPISAALPGCYTAVMVPEGGGLMAACLYDQGSRRFALELFRL